MRKFVVPQINKLFFLFFCLICSLSQAAPLGQAIVQDPSFRTRSITYEQVNGFAIVEDDIILAKMSTLSRNDAVFRLKLGGSRWEKGVVPFEVSDNLPVPSRLAVFKAIELWQKNSNVQFVELTNENRSHYTDYIVFVPAGGTTCSSYVGRQGGRQEVLLSTRCTMMSAVHEIGHALGLWHEQSRGDRDSYVLIRWENIEDGHQFNFDQHLTDGIDFGEYDYQSIMHYNAYAFSKNGEKTIVPLVDGVEIGQRTKLSEKDVAAVDAMYPKESMPLDE